MVIAAFTGVGKSYFADHVESAKDFPLMPYKYTDLGENTVTKAKGERSKADPSHILNPEWPDNYIRAVANQFHDYKYLVIPSDKQVLQGLQLLQIPYILVYPEQNAKNEYRRRYEERGNTEDFIHIFADQWDFWMNSLRKDSYGWSIEIAKDQYLLNAKEKIDEIIEREEAVIHFDVDQEIAEEAERILLKYDLSIPEYLRRTLIWSFHHEGVTQKMLQEYGGINLKKELIETNDTDN